MTDKTDEVLKRVSFKWGKNKKNPTGFKYGPKWNYKPTMSHAEPKENQTLLRGYKRSAPHESSHKFQETKDPEDPRLAGIYLGWKKKHEARTREELKKQEKE